MTIDPVQILGQGLVDYQRDENRRLGIPEAAGERALIQLATDKLCRRIDEKLGISGEQLSERLERAREQAREERMAEAVERALIRDGMRSATPGELELVALKAYQAAHPGMTLADAYVALAATDGVAPPASVQRLDAAIKDYQAAHPGKDRAQAAHALAASNPELFE